MSETNQESVISQVVANGLCVGCGLCAGALPTVLCMRTDEYGARLPELVAPETPGWGPQSLQVCPFADHEENEDTIAAGLYGDIEGIEHRPETGFYLQCFAGHVTDEATRMTATSGGLVTWLAGELLSGGQVDAVACVGPAEQEPDLFAFRLVTDRADLARCRKSRYYPVEMSEIIGRIKTFEGKVLFIALPCFLKGLHLAMKVDPDLRDRIGYTIGLVCGHLKTKKYAAYLARHCGVDESQIRTVDFRHKVAGKPAHKYAFSVSLRDTDEHREVLMQDVWAGSWGNNLFMLEACECCDDVFAETADVVIGDAWLPEYVRDSRGTSLVVCRKPEMLALLEKGTRDGRVSLEPLPIEKVIRSQSGALRQRREGLQYRLHRAAQRRQWRPRKRVSPDPRAGSWLFRCLQRLRLKLRRLSQEAFLAQEARDGLDLFKHRLRLWIFLGSLINLVRHAPNALKKRLRRFNPSQRASS